MKLCIDLCAGLGGFSQAFKDDYEVVTIDILRKFKPTILADVRYLPLKENLNPDVLLASPPCERFSIACPDWPRMGIKRAMECVGAVFESIAFLKPKFWLVENPMGRLRWFIGTPKQTIRYSDYDFKFKIHKKTDLWGNIPLPMPKAFRYFYQGHLASGWGKSIEHGGAPANAKIPLGVSMAVKEGIEIMVTEKKKSIVGGKQ